MNIYNFLMSNIGDYELSEEDRKRTIDRFVEKFVDRELIPKYILYWNSIKEKYRHKKKNISLEELNNLKFRYENNLYIYLERDKKAFKGSIQIINNFLAQQEPWEDTDIIVFDDSYSWFIAFSHEDEIIFLES